MNIVPITLFVLGAMFGSAIQYALRSWRPSRLLARSSFILAFAQLGVVALISKDSAASVALTSMQFIVGIAFGVVWFRFLRTKA